MQWTYIFVNPEDKKVDVRNRGEILYKKSLPEDMGQVVEQNRIDGVLLIFNLLLQSTTYAYSYNPPKGPWQRRHGRDSTESTL